ncbi:MAG: LysM peptidoglycan-binding domain-containing protein [Myxococcota bacterium]
MIALLALMLSASAAEQHVVRKGETIESIASSVGKPGAAAELRSLNGLADDAQPTAGTVINLPDLGGLQQPGQVLALVGTGTVTPPGGNRGNLAEGTFLMVGTRVCTGEDSFATIRLTSVPNCADEDDVTLLPKTCLTLEANHARADKRSSVVSLTSGSLAVRKSAAGGNVAVRTASGLTTGADGGFRVAVEDASTRSEAVSGAVAVLAEGAEKEVPQGFGVRTPKGEAPGELVELLPPGTPVAPEADAQLIVPDFGWTPVERALGYRVELASDDEFTRLVRRTEVGRNVWLPTQLFLPYDSPVLYWRVVSFDRLGFEGIPSEARAVRFPRGIAVD